MTATIINIFSASPPFGPPLTRTCASCCSWNAEEQLCENLVSGVPPEEGCDQHETHAEFWHSVENPTPETAGMRRVLKMVSKLRVAANDVDPRAAVYEALRGLLDDMQRDTSVKAAAQRLVGFTDLLTPIVGAGLQSWDMEEAGHA